MAGICCKDNKNIVNQDGNCKERCNFDHRSIDGLCCHDLMVRKDNDCTVCFSPKVIVNNSFCEDVCPFPLVSSSDRPYAHCVEKCTGILEEVAGLCCEPGQVNDKGYCKDKCTKDSWKHEQRQTFSKSIASERFINDEKYVSLESSCVIHITHS